MTCVWCKASEPACESRPSRCCPACDHGDELATAVASSPVHRLTKYLDESGWRASCCCGWSTTARTRERRDGLAGAHEVSP